MSIAKHVHSLQRHLAQFGLYPVPAEGQNEASSVFKICFLNKYEMERWRELRDENLQQEVLINNVENINQP